MILFKFLPSRFFCKYLRINMYKTILPTVLRNFELVFYSEGGKQVRAI